MSDFFQNGTITTLHNLGDRPVNEIEEELKVKAATVSDMGGVKVGENLQVDDTGKLSLGSFIFDSVLHGIYCFFLGCFCDCFLSIHCRKTIRNEKENQSK